MILSKQIYTYDDVKLCLNISSKLKVMQLLDEIEQNPKLTKFVYELAISNEHPFAWRASWALVHLVNKSPDLLKPYVSNIIVDIKNLKTDRQIASFLQILTKLEFEAQESAHLFDLAIGIIYDTKKQMYMKLYALHFLVKFVEKIPELTPELLLILEDEDLISENKYIRRQIKRIKNTLNWLC